MGIIQRWKLKRAFQRVKMDIANTRRRLSDTVFALTTEYAKMQLRIQDLEIKVERMEDLISARQTTRLEYPDYARSY